MSKLAFIAPLMFAVVILAVTAYLLINWLKEGSGPVEGSERGQVSKNTREALRLAFEKDIRKTWASFKAELPEQTPYALVLYGVDGGDPSLWPEILTEQGLDVVAKKYMSKGYMDTIEDARRELRYSVADSPYICKYEDQIPAIKSEIESRTGELSIETGGWTLLAEAGVMALKNLEKEGVFGTGDQRDSLLLYVHIEDSLLEISDSSAKTLNPPSAYEAFRSWSQVEGVFKSCGTLTISSNGAHLIGACSGAEEGKNELVMYSINAGKLERSWQFAYPAFGDSIRDILIPPSGTHFWTTRCQYSAGKATTLIQQFSFEGNTPLKEQKIPGETTSMSLSPDGKRLALLVNRSELFLLDDSLNTTWNAKIKSKCFRTLWLQSNDLLIATDTGILRLDANGELKETEVSGKTFSMSVTESEDLLAVGRWFDIGIFDEEEKKEFSFHIYELPSFTLKKEVRLPGYQVVWPTLSSDGSRVACVAQRIHGSRNFVMMFDTASGDRYWETESDSINEIAILPDNRTVVIPISGHMTSEPIIFYGNE